MNSIARFNARIAKEWNARVYPEMAHLESQNAYVYPRPAKARKEKPAVTTYKTTLTTLARPQAPSPEALEAERQRAIRATRIANLEKARAVKAANRQQETAEVNEIAALRAQVAALTAQIERLATPVAQPAQVAPTPAPAPRKAQPVAPAKVAKAPYVKTALKMVDYGKGRRALQIDNTLVVVAWNGATKTWDYACGTRKGTAADRGEAFAKVNVLLANAGLPPVRA